MPRDAIVKRGAVSAAAPRRYRYAALAALVLGVCVALALLVIPGGGAPTPASAAGTRSADPAGGAGGPPPATFPAQPGIVIPSPAPGSDTASVATQISLLGTPALRLRAVEVTGSRSGLHSGRLERYSQGDGVSFVPTRPFRPGELVTVRTGIPLAGAPSGTFRFRVGRRLTVAGHERLPGLATTVAGVEHYVSAPRIEPPSLTVLAGARSGGGDLFLSPKGAVGQAGPMIVTASGRLVWFHPLQGAEAFDFNLQRLGNRPVLTWFQGVVSDAHGVGEDIIASTSYKTLYVLDGANGFAPDLHELQVLPNGVAIVTSYQALQENLTSAGGFKDGLAWDGIAQVIDVRTGLVEYEWHSLDHVPPAQSVRPAPKVASHIYDYFHINSIQALANGDLLIGARNTSAVYDVVPAQDGRVRWTLGGRHSSFSMGRGATFWLQHDARELPDGTITIFDDEATPHRLPYSRAIALHLDFSTMTATLDHAYVHAPPLLAGALGNVETMPGGDEFVEWGTTPWMSEYGTTGETIFDAHLPGGDDTYRAYRYPYRATPSAPPSLVVTGGATAPLVAHLSWNGATGVQQWRLVALSRSSSSGAPSLTVPDHWFETVVRLPAAWTSVRAEAIGAGGQVLGSTPPVAASLSSRP